MNEKLVLCDEEIWKQLGYVYGQRLIIERSNSMNKVYITAMWDGDRQVPDSELKLAKSIYLKTQQRLKENGWVKPDNDTTFGNIYNP
jgi:hypothetical protein